ncbi:MAG: hypothetical protein ABSC20_07000 [Candidatus Bathyarchaeia archaeon]
MSVINMGKPVKKSFGETALKWLLRFIKFNIVGFTVFLIGTAIFALTFSTLGAWAWLVASGSGGILQFILISYLNRTKRGKIFDSCEQRNQQENEDKKINKNKFLRSNKFAVEVEYPVKL